MKKVFSLLLVLCMMISLTGAAAEGLTVDFSSAVSQAEGTEIADTLTAVFKAEPSNLFAPNNTEIYTATVERLIYDTLITRDEDQNFVGDLAESWEYLDELTVRFAIKKGETFSNGQEVTSEDVAFSIMYNSDESSKSLIYGLIDHCDCVDDYTVDIVTKSPNAALFSNLAHPRTSIFCKSYFEEVGADVYGREPVGSGPYVLKEWVTGSSITVTAREDYVGEKPVMKNIVFKPIAESANRSIELETEGCDILIDPEPNDLARLTDEGFNVMRNASYAISQFGINIQNVPDINIRKAMAYAVDYEAVVDAVYGDMGIVAKGILPLIMPGYEPNYDVNYDPDYAKQLVAESETPEGLTVQLIVPNDTELTRLAEFLQFYWKEVGIDVEINQADQASIRERADRGDYGVNISNSSWTTGDPSRPTSSFSGKGIRSNYGFDEEFAQTCDDYWNKALSITGNDEERFAVYSEYQKLIIDQWIFVPLAHKSIAYVTTDKVDNFYADPNGSPDLSRVTLYR